MVLVGLSSIALSEATLKNQGITNIYETGRWPSALVGAPKIPAVVNEWR